mmetsp:Transcript_18503/g.60239  ORF Transcript_18503/g.60239 Transcript_18503/m.60239 type:complete len:328 (+) Transcript_18503:654-1637(+)
MGLVLLEHINLNTPNRADCVAFYHSALRAALSPIGTKRHQLHINAGLFQFHLPFAKSPDSADADPGPITDLVGGKDSVREVTLSDGDAYLGVGQTHLGTLSLWAAPDALEEVQERLRAIGAPVLGSSAEELGAEASVVRTRCPHGNSIELWPAPAEVAADVARAGAHTGGGGSVVVGLRELRLRVGVGNAHKIANFYRKVLGAQVRVTEGEMVRAEVVTGPHQQLVFEEATNAPPPHLYTQDPRTHGWHIALYVRDWAGSRDRCEALGLLARSPTRFAALDSPLERVQYRIIDVVDPDTGERLLELEHELRSLAFPSCPLTEAEHPQ